METIDKKVERILKESASKQKEKYKNVSDFLEKYKDILEEPKYNLAPHDTIGKFFNLHQF